ncbi:signal peptide peptidase SppA, partial [Xanthomonas citri pv. citri]|nr:signal peptide peptidase SppA [Xanthomonas citri pv. citri]
SSVLKISLSGEIPEYTEEDPFSFTKLLMEEKVTSLETILKSIDIASNSRNIKAIYLDIDYLTAGYGTLSEIREALHRFQETG